MIFRRGYLRAERRKAILVMIDGEVRVVNATRTDTGWLAPNRGEWVILLPDGKTIGRCVAAWLPHTGWAKVDPAIQAD